ncbi:WYL domain-containing protein [Pelagibaculum spongiae]|uniref:WYL domain-containing protein n=1 Tax=Pelagibaculum spongiae TaxID=2080658 RepID=A0A2V1GY43_9GAMM|nr:WYL domain-containing protein [Pelagibaculum spongiae]PVZ72004.1 WYL domain-containing protein [Pelagibaculum spongiae]
MNETITQDYYPSANNHAPNRLLEVTQAQRARLFYIDFRLFFYGTINRADLVARFGIKEAAASRDLSLYKEIAPKNIEYDTKGKSYIQRQSENIKCCFAPLFEYTANQTLASLLHGFGDDFLGVQEPLIPCISPVLLNAPDLQSLALITKAIYQKKILKITYHSLTSGLSQKEITPFALINNGLHWHVRGYDRSQKRFADFVINRIELPQLIDKTPSKDQTKTADDQWNKIVELRIQAHPKLEHPKTIEHEYAMQNGELKIEVRAAIAGYVLRYWNVDCSDQPNSSLAGFHLWLANKDALKRLDNLILATGNNYATHIMDD